MSKERKDCLHERTVIIEKEEIYNVKGEDIKVNAHVRKCLDCNEEILDMVLDTDNLKQAYDIYRKKHNMLSTKDIINLRRKYNHPLHIVLRGYSPCQNQDFRLPL